MTQTIEELLDSAEPRTADVTVPVRGSAASKLEGLHKRLQAAVEYDETHNEPDTAPPIRDEINKLADEAEADGFTFKFESVSRRDWSTLMRDNPPNENDAKAGYDYDLVEFPVKAIAASCVAPTMTVEQVEQLADTLSAGAFDLIWQACARANIGMEDQALVPFFARQSADLIASLASSATADPEESPTASS